MSLRRSLVYCIPLILMFATTAAHCGDFDGTSRQDVLSSMKKAADWQLARLSPTPSLDWVYGAFYAGVMALAEISPATHYAEAMDSVGQKNGWRLGPRPYHADDHCVGQTYLELYAIRKNTTDIEPTRKAMDELVKHLTSETKLTWDWCDALFMAPPTLAKLYKATGDKKYLDVMDSQWKRTAKALYDPDEHLFYRDANFLTQKTKNGKKVFWSRGNGWVLAGLARVLECMPEDYPSRQYYVTQFKEMSQKVATLQGSDGLWRPSLLDSEDIPTGETSGTGFFCYAMAWGINNGILDDTTYGPVVEKAWRGLAGALEPSGLLKHVQPIGYRPEAVAAEGCEPYGTGAFLLAGSEVYKMIPPNDKAVSSEKDKALDLTIQQFRSMQLGQSDYLKPALTYASSLREDGSWADIDYQSKQRAAWPTGGHVGRVLTMTSALAAGKASPTQSEAIEAAVHKALAYWSAHDFQCPNWWYNEIGGPKQFGPIALLLGARLKPEEFDYITKTVLKRSRIAMTGQNRVWLAGNTLMDGLLRRDEKTVANAASVIFSEIAITGSEGIQPDFSYHQHGPQLQFGNYGLSFADDQLKWAEILRGTPWAMPDEKFGIVRRYLLDGLDWVVWRGTMDISCCGRQISPKSPEGKGSAVSKFISRLATIDKTCASQAAATVKRNLPGAKNDLIGSRFFWRSDYLVNRRKDVCYTLKMCSKRVIGAESLNSENLSGYHLADGALYLYQNSDEYQDIFPVWNWRRIPGVTCAQNDGPLPSFGSYRLESDFVGGAADGTNACAAMDYRRDGVSAKKSWFFAGDQVVCLGAGIKADAAVSAPITTSINQCHLRGEVRMGKGKNADALAAGIRSFDDAQWIEHNGVRYTSLQPQKIVVSNQPQTGNWSKVFKTDSTPKADVTQDVFSMWIDHGSNPDGGTYAYSISPVEKGRTEQPSVLANSEKLQAVAFGRFVEAVFYTSGTLTWAPGHTLTVDSPCIVLLDLTKKAPRLTVADPTQTLKSLGAGVDGRQMDIRLPVGTEAGSGVSSNIPER